MNEHHHSTNCSAGLEQENPTTIEEKKHRETKLDGVSKGLDVVDPVVQRLPDTVLKYNIWCNGVLAELKNIQLVYLVEGVPHEEHIDEDGDEHLDNHLDTEGGDGEEPGANCETLPQEVEKGSRRDNEEAADQESLKGDVHVFTSSSNAM